MSEHNGNLNNSSNILLLNNNENSASPERNINSENPKNTVNSLLHLSEDDETSLPEVEEGENATLVETKHSLVNSPWSRFGIVGGGAAVIFFLIYLFLGPIMNGNFASKKETKDAVIPTVTEETKESKKDGDVYAKLALQRQADELALLNGLKTQKKPIVTPTENKDLPEKPLKTVTATSKPVQLLAATSEPPRRVASVPQVATSSLPRRIASPPIVALAPTPRTIIRYSPPPFTSPPIPVQTKPLVPRQTEVAVKPTDPLAELERLRSLGSAGRIYYTANTNSTENGGSSDNIDDTEYTPRRRLSDRRSSKTEVATVGTLSATTPTSGGIELLKPRWTPNTVRLRNLSVEAGRGAEGQRGGGANSSFSSAPLLLSTPASPATEELGTRNNGDYSREEAGIIEGKQEQYLVVGEHAAATLETPLIWSPGSASQFKSQFVARLTEPLRSNTGVEAIPTGTLISVEMLLVEQSGRAIAQVTAILKDGTEYPVSSGAISVSGTEGKPLIAHQYQKKGGEIFSLDAGLGLVSGLAKVGEVINQPDTQTSISQSGGGFSSVQSSSNGRRSIGAALLQGSFGAVSEQVKARNRKALEEIAARPNIFFVKKGTKILITVNRSMQL